MNWQMRHTVVEAFQSENPLVIHSLMQRSKSSADDEIDVNRCCACCGMYADDAGTGREWLQFRCSRWIHEDCIDDDDVDVEQSRTVYF